MVTTGFFRGERFDADKEIPDLEGQVYIVTGGSQGIGFGIVANLLKHNPSKIIILSSNEEVAKTSIDKLKKYGDNSVVIWKKCNLRNLTEVDQVAKSLRDYEPRIDSLILNAGIGVAPFSLTNDTIDGHFQINALSQLHLALMLLPILRRSSTDAKGPTRLVMMSSEMHRFSPGSTKFESVQELNEDLGGIGLYGRSKLAQILLIQELALRVDNGEFGFTKIENTAGQKRTVLINATHPGGVKTAQQDQMGEIWGWFGRLLTWLIRPLMVDPVDVGCITGLVAGTPTEFLVREGGLNGQYIVPDKQISKPSKQAQNNVLQNRLWTLSINLLKDKIGRLDYEFDVE